MPGYILHLTEAELLIQKFKQYGYDLDEQWINAFRLGCLLPDTKKKTDKVTSHFWNQKDMVNWAIPPEVSAFEEKYHAYLTLEHPLELGYYFHLILDERFVNVHWDSILQFLDTNGQPAARKDTVTTVTIKKSNTRVSIADFFSSQYYYGDYSRLNDYYLNKYHIVVPFFDDTLHCAIEEVNYKDLQTVLAELRELQNRSKETSDNHLTVFDQVNLEQFIIDTAKESFHLLHKSGMWPHN